jgi:uncharacterized protein YdeI (YjbR/CyaY-like superfamily)
MIGVDMGAHFSATPPSQVSALTRGREYSKLVPLMAEPKLTTLDVRSRARWRAWLEAHHDSVDEIWLVFHKRHTGKPSIVYGEALDEALCFGWVDSRIRRLDDDRYALRFTPRKPESRWSNVNRKRYATLEAQGLLAPAGRARGPTAQNAYPPRRKRAALPRYVAKALKADAKAWATFERLAPGYRRMYAGWIDNAKRKDTKAKRIREAIALLRAGKTLPMK